MAVYVDDMYKTGAIEIPYISRKLAEHRTDLSK